MGKDDEIEDAEVVEIEPDDEDLDGNALEHTIVADAQPPKTDARNAKGSLSSDTKPSTSDAAIGDAHASNEAPASLFPIGQRRPGLTPPRRRLSDKAEKIAYFFALLVGGAILLIGKVNGWLAPWPGAFLALGFICTYFLFAFIANRENPIRSDRLGDNCYYLGLVYTLASLIAALIVLERGAEVESLLGNFGIALVSTAAGIIARLIMIQFRTETDDVDAEARNAIAEAANEMRSDLEDAASTFRRLMISAQETFELSISRTKQSVAEAAQLTDLIEQMEVSPEQLNTSLVGVVARLEEAAMAISASSEALRLHADAVGSTANAVERADTGLANIQDVLKALSHTLETHRKATEATIAAMERQSADGGRFRAELERDAEKARAAAERVYSAMGDLAYTVADRLNR